MDLEFTSSGQIVFHLGMEFAVTFGFGILIIWARASCHCLASLNIDGVIDLETIFFGIVTHTSVIIIPQAL